MLGFAPSNGAGLLYSGCVAPEGHQVQIDVPPPTTLSVWGSASTGLDISQEVTGDAALRDFEPAYVRFGSGADVTCLLSNVRFAPSKRTSRACLDTSGRWSHCRTWRTRRLT